MEHGRRPLPVETHEVALGARAWRHGTAARLLAVGVVLGLVLLLAMLGVRLTVVVHSPEAAAAVAEEYVRLVLVEGNIGAAYELMTPAIRERVSFDDFAARMSRAPGYMGVRSVNALEYEVLSGEPAVVIYLAVSGTGGVLNYLVILQGTMKSGYGVADFQFLPEPLTPSGERKKL
ncbi:MAG: hypothetical protein KKA32_14840 [Actinobacteria bacterium]|nr:hypothetical protein [Actinomycetota bacterium]